MSKNNQIAIALVNFKHYSITKLTLLFYYTTKKRKAQGRKGGEGVADVINSAGAWIYMIVLVGGFWLAILWMLRKN